MQGTFMILAMAWMVSGLTPGNQLPKQLCRLYARSMPTIVPAPPPSTVSSPRTCRDQTSPAQAEIEGHPQMHISETSNHSDSACTPVFTTCVPAMAD